MKGIAGDVTSAPTKTLLALIAVHQRDGRATLRTVAEYRGVTFTTIQEQMRRLVRMGLAAQDGAGTLRPLVWPVKMLT